MRTEASIRPVLVAGLGVGVLSCMDATMKMVASVYPLGQVVGLRYGAGAFFALVVFAILREDWPDWAALRRNLVRAIVMLATAATFFTALARLPLAEAVALTFISPLLMALLSRTLLGEPVSRRTLVGIVIGLAGVMVIARGQEVDPDQAFDPVGLGAALACAFFYALSMVMMRQQSARDSMITIVTLSNSLACLLVAPVMVLQWQAPTRTDLMIFLVAGLFGTLGHLCLAWAYTRAPAGRLGIMEYTAFIWASICGFLFFSEIPTAWTVSGAVLIVLACLFAAWNGAKSAPVADPTQAG